MATDKNDEAIADEVLDQLLKGRDPGTVFESGGLVDALKKRLAERMLNAEMDHHLGGPVEEDTGNHRNGYGSKTVITDTGKLELAIPRDRHGRFDPVLIGKYRRRFAGFDEKIIGLYARGMSTREIAEHIGELYGAEISADLVSTVTDSVLEEVAAWQSRGLEATYAVVFFDALRVKIGIMLEETNLAYEPHRIDIMAHENHDTAFLALNPNGKIPAIYDPDGPSSECRSPGTPRDC